MSLNVYELSGLFRVAGIALRAILLLTWRYCGDKKSALFSSQTSLEEQERRDERTLGLGAYSKLNLQQVIEIWDLVYISTRFYSKFSPNHNSLSRFRYDSATTQIRAPTSFPRPLLIPGL